MNLFKTFRRWLETLSNQTVLCEIRKINRGIEIIMATQQEAAAQLAAFTDQLGKAKAEILSKIADLEAAAGNTDVSPELQAAIDALKPAAQALDDIVPDAPTP